MLKKGYLVISILVLILLFSACGASTEVSAPEPSDTSSPTAETPEPIKESLEITDFLGRKRVIDALPERIVSLSPSTTELLYELGVGDKLVGVTSFDDYPVDVIDLPKVGGFEGPNLEAILEQEPDIVLASSISGKEQMEAIEKLDITVLVLEARTIEQIYDAITLLSLINEVEDTGQKLIETMQDQMNTIYEKVKGKDAPNVFYLVDTDGNFTAGKGTFIDEMITLAGGNNVAGHTEGWVQYRMEELVEQNPDIIITSPHSADVENLSSLAGYKETNAVKNGDIYVISDSNLISRASHRIVLGLEEIANMLHPEVF